MTRAAPGGDPETAGVVLRLTDVSFRYRSGAGVGPLSVDIGPGITGLLGLNGAGKTTLLRMMATVTHPAQGRLEMLGVDVAGRRAKLTHVRQRLGYLPQDATWAGSLTIREMLEVFAWMRHLPRPLVGSRVDRALERTKLTGLARRRLGSLSGGEHRRAMLAQALLAEPGLLVLDEPTAGLDPRQRVQMRRLLTEVARDTTTIISTHLLEDVSRLADRLLVLHDGGLAFAGTSRELAGSPDAAPSAAALERGFLRAIGEADDE